MAAITDQAYDRLVQETISQLQQQLDNMLEILDWESHGDILYIFFEDGEKVVINKQPPLHQLWFACKEGGKQFAWSGSEWIDVRGGGTFQAAITRLFERKGISI